MAYKFTIKGIRKFNEERVVEKFFDAFKEIEKIEDVKILNHNPVNDETDSYTVMTLNVSTQGVNIKHLVSKRYSCGTAVAGLTDGCQTMLCLSECREEGLSWSQNLG